VDWGKETYLHGWCRGDLDIWKLVLELFKLVIAGYPHWSSRRSQWCVEIVKRKASAVAVADLVGSWSRRKVAKAIEGDVRKGVSCPLKFVDVIASQKVCHGCYWNISADLLWSINMAKYH